MLLLPQHTYTPGDLEANTAFEALHENTNSGLGKGLTIGNSMPTRASQNITTRSGNLNFASQRVSLSNVLLLLAQESLRLANDPVLIL